jgi:ADP-ribose pyrophosphatase YjhB (NUDIX family)
VQPDIRRYPAKPILGVGALVFDRDRVLLVQRGNEPLKGWWSLPGGAVEAGERVEDAVCREVLEETNLEVRVVRFGEIFERIMPDAAGEIEYHYVLLDYVCEVRGGILRAGSDSADVRWFSPEELKELPITSGTLEVVERCRTGAKSY